MSHNFEQLKQHILPLSKSTVFERAKLEWDLVSVEITEDWDHCPCGQEIKEHCYIRNRLTGSETYVGNVCINRFLGIDTGTLFDGLKRIAKDLHASPNQAVIDYATKRGNLFGQNERDFLLGNMKKRNLSAKQLDWRKKINLRILKDVQVSARRH